MNIKTQLISKGSKRRGGARITRVGFFVDHDTGNGGSTAQNNVDYYCRTCNEQSASAHVFIDDKGTIVCIPCHKNDAEKAWHVLYDRPLDNKLYGDDANDIAIGLELCFFPKDKARTQKAYNNYIEFAAMLCKDHGVAPAKRSAHSELDPGRKVDPQTALKIIGKTYADMKQDIVAKYNQMYNSKDAEYKRAVDKLATEGIITQMPVWWPKLNLNNAEFLIKSFGRKVFGTHTYADSVQALAKAKISVSPVVWLNRTHNEENLKMLVVNMANYLK